jgi:hypothetical protein
MAGNMQVVMMQSRVSIHVARDEWLQSLQAC